MKYYLYTILFAVITAIIISGCAGISPEACRENRSKTVCVLPLKGDTQFNVTLRLIQHYRKRCYNVVARNELNSILEEQRQQHSGAFDKATAMKLGKLVGADYIIYGSVYTRDESNYTAIYANHYMVKVQTGEIERVKLDELIKEVY